LQRVTRGHTRNIKYGSGTTRTARISFLGRCAPLEKLHDLKEHICSYDNLFEAYVSAAKGKADRAEVMRFKFNLEVNLFQIQRELLDGTYKVGPYREFYVRYPKPRLVMALGFKDRVVQWAIYRQIDPYVDKRFITHSYGCRREKGTLAAAQTLMNWQRIISRKPDADDYWIIKGDISKYFYRVDHELVLDFYRDICDEDWFMWLMDTIINNPDVPFGLPEGMGIDECPRDQRLFEIGQPIGNLTSQETANIYLDRFDQWCKHALGLHYYVRYMDDFCAIVKGKDNAARILRAMTQYLRDELRLDMSRKARIVRADRDTEFVGYRVSPHGLRLRKKTVQHIKRSLKHVAGLYADGAIPYDRAKDSVICYWGLAEHCNGQYIRRWIEENVVLKRREEAA